ncbi:hypothetical protein BBO_08719 [Beauveria brongniartii RCEF 3172]|uniref:Uncharacterized protein n=1 Tax=Beauveria brongniartii RCEF 3172 TaxID=1081107 RepID=A0A166S0M4_9HYPO|nr:hypothetical protein BBO_08719 [Beauveria brongniartii RCEF 3172]
MNPSSTPSEKSKTSYVFHVVAKARRIYGPVATMIEMPPDEESWSDVSGLWVADRSRLIYKFLANKNPKSRCKLQAEVDLAIEQNNQHPCWFREDAEELSAGPNTVTPRMRAKALQDIKSMWYPYTTCGINNCLKGPGTPGVDGDNVSLPTKPGFWTPGSLKTFIDQDSNYTIVVFDITDLNNIAYNVLVCIGGRRIRATMKWYCEYELEGSSASNPVISFFDGIPEIKPEILQMFLENETLYQFVTIPEVSTLSSIFERHRSSILDGKTVDDIFGDDVRLASIANLTCRDIIKVVQLASKVVSLSISFEALCGVKIADLDSLVTALAMLPSLAVVYIVERVFIPGKHVLPVFMQSVTVQAFFFQRVRLQSEELWKKVQGSSMYFWRMNDQLRVSFHGEICQTMEDKLYQPSK